MLGKRGQAAGIAVLLALILLLVLWPRAPVLTWEERGGRDYFNIQTTDATGERLEQRDRMTVCTLLVDGLERCRFQWPYPTHGVITMRLQTCYYPSPPRPDPVLCSEWKTATRGRLGFKL